MWTRQPRERDVGAGNAEHGSARMEKSPLAWAKERSSTTACAGAGMTANSGEVFGGVLQGVHTLFESVETCRNLVESAGKIIHLFHPMKTEARGDQSPAAGAWAEFSGHGGRSLTSAHKNRRGRRVRKIATNRPSRVIRVIL